MRTIKWGASLLAVALICGGLPRAGMAASSGWNEVASWPDFMGGVWGDFGAGGPDFNPKLPKPQYKPAYQAKAAASAESFQTAQSGIGAQTCVPHGFPTDIGGEFYYTKGMIFLMTDLDYNSTRRIDMTRKTHGDYDLTYYGDSIGHWEGDTLVVDTVGFLPEVGIASRGPGGDSKTHVIERYRLIAPDTLQLDMVVENPELLEKPWVTTRTLPLHRDWTVHEAFCAQNNREIPVAGDNGINLTNTAK